MTSWLPASIEGTGPLYLRLATALEADVASGALRAGARLPPQRDLADRLGIGIGTVTRAYAEAESRGFLVGRVGSGSFVRGRPPAAMPEAAEAVDLARNIVPLGPAAAEIAASFARLARQSDLACRLAYAPPAGFEADRRAGAAWLDRTANFRGLDWRRLICCAGAQQALSYAFGAICRPGDRILTEAATFFGVKALAEQAGYRLQGLAMDGEGLLPEALDRAAAESSARVLYTLPTLQNPTGRIMGAQRRREITDIARRRDLWIVEDDIYRIFADDPAIEPLALLAPERCFYMSGASKSLAQGLRVGWLVTPPGQAFEDSLRVVRACSYAPPGFGSLIATQWIGDGTADRILAGVLAEMRERTATAMRLIGQFVEPPRAAAVPHLWLPLPEYEAEHRAARAAKLGIRVTPPDAPRVGAGAETGLRLCLGAAETRGVLERALTALASCLGGGRDQAMRDVV